MRNKLIKFPAILIMLLLAMANSNAQTKLSGRVYDYGREMDLETAQLGASGDGHRGQFLFLNDSVLIKIDYCKGMQYTPGTYRIGQGPHEQLPDSTRRWAKEAIYIEMNKQIVKVTAGNNIEKTTAGTAQYISMQYGTALNDKPYYFSEEGYGGYLYMVPSRKKLNAVLKELKAKGVWDLLDIK